MRRIIVIAAISGLLFGSRTIAQTSHTGMRGIKAMEAVADMAPGVNLWNTLDAYYGASQGLESETTWGQPRTTEAMIKAFKDRGFKTLRLPVTWYNHTGAAPDYKIDSVWMNRVEEVANYAFKHNMYVIINLHHEDYDATKPGTWLCPTTAKQAACTDRIEKIWKQIATRFKDYGDYLLFETMNEPREVGSKDEWTGGTTEHRTVVNAFNLAAVNAIRSVGGNNQTRFIMIPQIAATSTAAINNMVIPNADTNIIVSIHNYNPYFFCLDENGYKTWGTASDIAALQSEIKACADKFVKNGQAVIIGEWGVVDKKPYADRIAYYDVFARTCKEQSITPISWIYSFNRRTLKWDSPLIEDAIINAYNPNSVAAQDLQLNIVNDTLFVGDSLQLAASLSPSNATSQTVVWTSYNSTAAQVNQNGMIKAKAKGKARITATVIGKTTAMNLVVLDQLLSTPKAESTPVEVYPNPANDKLTLRFSKSLLSVAVYSLDGVLLFQYLSPQSPMVIDVSALKPGEYVLKTTSSEGVDSTQVMIAR